VAGVYQHLDEGSSYLTCSPDVQFTLKDQDFPFPVWISNSSAMEIPPLSDTTICPNSINQCSRKQSPDRGIFRV
jgi:hypothetical protein